MIVLDIRVIGWCEVIHFVGRRRLLFLVSSFFLSACVKKKFCPQVLVVPYHPYKVRGNNQGGSKVSRWLLIQHCVGHFEEDNIEIATAGIDAEEIQAIYPQVWRSYDY